MILFLGVFAFSCDDFDPEINYYDSVKLKNSNDFTVFDTKVTGKIDFLSEKYSVTKAEIVVDGETVASGDVSENVFEYTINRSDVFKSEEDTLGASKRFYVYATYGDVRKEMYSTFHTDKAAVTKFSTFGEIKDEKFVKDSLMEGSTKVKYTEFEIKPATDDLDETKLSVYVKFKKNMLPTDEWKDITAIEINLDGSEHDIEAGLVSYTYDDGTIKFKYNPVDCLASDEFSFELISKHTDIDIEETTHVTYAVSEHSMPANTEINLSYEDNDDIDLTVCDLVLGKAFLNETELGKTKDAVNMVELVKYADWLNKYIPEIRIANTDISYAVITASEYANIAKIEGIKSDLEKLKYNAYQATSYRWVQQAVETLTLQNGAANIPVYKGDCILIKYAGTKTYYGVIKITEVPTVLNGDNSGLKDNFLGFEYSINEFKADDLNI